MGQSGNTLSGGESQRLKLATSMLQKRKGTTLYLFDEPSTGLYYFDMLQLITVFQSLVNRGDTVLFIEHNSTLIASADQVITLGPSSGRKWWGSIGLRHLLNGIGITNDTICFCFVETLV